MGLKGINHVNFTNGLITISAATYPWPEHTQPWNLWLQREGRRPPLAGYQCYQTPPSWSPWSSQYADLQASKEIKWKSSTYHIKLHINLSKIKLNPYHHKCHNEYILLSVCISKHTSALDIFVYPHSLQHWYLCTSTFTSVLISLFINTHLSTDNYVNLHSPQHW